ncbi:MAG: 5-formyltetrahydrofolate cyclo-ligase [Parvularculales bacterium]
MPHFFSGKDSTPSPIPITHLENDRAQARTQARRLRKQAARRLGLSFGRASRLLMHQFQNAIRMRQTMPSVVAGYWPIGYEIDPRPLMGWLASRGVGLALPVVIERDEPLMFRAWQKEDPLVPDSLGIMAPVQDAKTVVPHIILTPLLAFDDEGFRLGYGGGFYDRTLKELRRTRNIEAVGLAFSAQYRGLPPREPYDEPLDMVVTERWSLDSRC